MSDSRTVHEVNFDGLIGPTHNYAGLSYGNLASTHNRSLVSNPREAALQGLQKMRSLSELGLQQAVLPPQDRPDISILRKLGFKGPDEAVLNRAARTIPEIFLACCSASSMWTANAATVAPSADTADGKVHFTPANLVTQFHRSIESSTTSRSLRAIFDDSRYFVHHESLPSHTLFGDEGAANHTRLASDYGKPGVQLFVYGRSAMSPLPHEPQIFPARQSFEASSAIARLHGLSLDRVVFAQQNPDAIDLGVFHNDVVSVGNLNVFFFHESAFARQAWVLAELNEKFQNLSTQRQGDSNELRFIQVSGHQVSLKDAISSYLFNSQLIRPPGQRDLTLIAPIECQENRSVQLYLDQLISEGGTAIQRVNYLNLRQSMYNGGGPACLRLRVVLTEPELQSANSGVFLDQKLDLRLTEWIQKHYRDRLALEDLKDPQLMREGQTALDELTQILNLGSIYPFQTENTAAF